MGSLCVILCKPLFKDRRIVSVALTPLYHKHAKTLLMAEETIFTNRAVRSHNSLTTEGTPVENTTPVHHQSFLKKWGSLFV
jgi:hypothetical protein